MPFYSIPLPEFPARKQIIELLMASQRHALTEESVDDICHRTDGYSCADMTNLCKEAAYGPIRSIALEDIEHITPDQVLIAFLSQPLKIDFVYGTSSGRSVLL